MQLLRNKIKQISIYAVLFFCLFAFLECDAAEVGSAPLSSSPTAKNGMVRVYLQSIGSLSKIDITIDGSYSVSGSSSFNLQSGEKLTVSMNTSTGALTLVCGGTSFQMGKEFVLRRHQTSGANGLKIAQTRQSENLYPGDLYIRAVSSGGSYKMYAIVHVYIEYYLEGVIPYEMGNSANTEALKAQAVAARTYTLSRMNQRKNMSYDVVDTVNDQVYYGNSPSTFNCTNAVNQTRGIVLMYGNDLASTYYSASNGGQTESAENLWNMGNLPYLTVKNDPFDLLNTSSISRKVNVYKDFYANGQNGVLQSLLTRKIKNQYGITDFSIVSIDDINPHSPMYASPSELYTKLDFDLTVSTSYGTRTMTVSFDIFSELEQPLGMSINASKNEIWSVDKIGGNFIIYSRRFGHGIGMSQRGAMQMGSMGYTYDQILGFYYPGCYRLQYVMTHTVLSPVSSGGSSVFVQSENPAELTSGDGVTAQVTLFDKGGILPVRYSPDNSAKVLTGVVNGGLVSLLSTDKTWAKVKIGEIVGFVPDMNLIYSSLPSSSFSTQPTDINTWATVECSGTLNLRSSNSLSSQVIGQIPSGSILCVFSSSSGWAKVQYGALSGYASADFLSFSSEYPGVVSELSGNAFINAPSKGETVNLRTEPSMSSSVVAAMADSSPVYLFSMDSSWCKVSFNGISGYVMTKYVSSSQEKTFSTNPPANTPAPSKQSHTSNEEAVVYTVSTGLNFRKSSSTSSEIIAVIPRGESVTVISKGGDWTQIRYCGIAGFVKTEYLRFSSSSLSPVSSSYVVTPGGPLNLRSNPSIGSNLVAQIPEGCKVDVYSSSGDWTQIKYKDNTGYVMSKYLSSSPSSVVNAGNSAIVATKNGGLNLREMADANSRVIAIIPSGTKLEVISSQSGWCKVKYMGKTGFVMDKFLSFSQSEYNYSGTMKVQVKSSNGGSLNLRERPDADARVMCSIPYGAILEVQEAGNDWYSTKYNGISGYVMSRYTVKYTGGSTTASTQLPAAGNTSTYMWVSSAGGVNLRAAPDITSELITVIPQGTRLSVTSNGDWCSVTYNNLTGYVMKKFLSSTGTSSASVSKGTSTISSFGRAVSLLSSPSDSSNIVALIPDGTQVVVLSRNGDWCNVSWGNASGYLPANVIAEYSGKTSSDYSTAASATVSTEGSRLNVRQSPSFSSAVKFSLDNGSVVQIIQLGSEWCHIKYGDYDGWCSSTYLSIGE